MSPIKGASGGCISLAWHGTTNGNGEEELTRLFSQGEKLNCKGDAKIYGMHSTEELPWGKLNKKNTRDMSIFKVNTVHPSCETRSSPSWLLSKEETRSSKSNWFLTKSNSASWQTSMLKSPQIGQAFIKVQQFTRPWLLLFLVSWENHWAGKFLFGTPVFGTGNTVLSCYSTQWQHQTTNSGTSSWARSKEKYLLALLTGKAFWILMHCWAKQPLQYRPSSANPWPHPNV